MNATPDRQTDRRAESRPVCAGKGVYKHRGRIIRRHTAYSTITVAFHAIDLQIGGTPIQMTKGPDGEGRDQKEKKNTLI